MSEKTFQNLLTRYLTPEYFVSFNDMYNNPGYPDLLITKGDKFILAELKEMKNEKALLSKKFTKYQIPWYLNYLKLAGKNLWIIARLTEESYKYVIARIVPSIKYCKRFKDVLTNSPDYGCYESVAQIKSYIDEVFNV